MQQAHKIQHRTHTTTTITSEKQQTRRRQRTKVKQPKKHNKNARHNRTTHGTSKSQRVWARTCANAREHAWKYMNLQNDFNEANGAHAWCNESAAWTNKTDTPKRIERTRFWCTLCSSGLKLGKRCRGVNAAVTQPAQSRHRIQVK